MDLCSLQVTSNFRFECDICSKTFPNEVRLTVHSASDHGIHKNMCEYCGKKFITSDILAEHCKELHQSEKKEYACQSCPKTFKTESLRDEHNKVHRPDKCVCKICKTVCCDENALQKHLDNHTLQDLALKPDIPEGKAKDIVKALPVFENLNGKSRNPKRKNKTKSHIKSPKAIGDVVQISNAVERNEINHNLFKNSLCKIQDGLDKLMKLAEACSQASEVNSKKDKTKEESHRDRKACTNKLLKTETVESTSMLISASEVLSLNAVSDTSEYDCVPSQGLFPGSNKLFRKSQAHTRLLEDFLIPALNDETYGELLRWVSKPSVFGIKWVHKASNAWNMEESALFLAWDTLKGRQLPTNANEIVISKQRLRAALRNTHSVKEIQKIGAYKLYKIIDEQLIRQAATGAKIPRGKRMRSENLASVNKSRTVEHSKLGRTDQLGRTVEPSEQEEEQVNEDDSESTDSSDSLYEPSSRKKKRKRGNKWTRKRAALARKHRSKIATYSKMPRELRLILEQQDEFEHNPKRTPKRMSKVSQESWADGLEITRSPIKEENFEVEETVEASENMRSPTPGGEAPEVFTIEDSWSSHDESQDQAFTVIQNDSVRILDKVETVKPVSMVGCINLQLALSGDSQEEMV